MDDYYNLAKEYYGDWEYAKAIKKGIEGLEKGDFRCAYIVYLSYIDSDDPDESKAMRYLDIGVKNNNPECMYEAALLRRSGKKRISAKDALILLLKSGMLTESDRPYVEKLIEGAEKEFVKVPPIEMFGFYVDIGQQNIDRTPVKISVQIRQFVYSVRLFLSRIISDRLETYDELVVFCETNDSLPIDVRISTCESVLLERANEILQDSTESTLRSLKSKTSSNTLIDCLDYCIRCARQRREEEERNEKQRSALERLRLEMSNRQFIPIGKRPLTEEEMWELELRTELKKRKITKLLHFTDEKNLPSICMFGLYPQDELDSIGIEYKSDNIYSNHRDCVSVSVGRINEKMLRYRMNEGKLKNPVILTIDLDVLFDRNVRVLFCEMNAATKGARKGESVKWFKQMFNEYIIDKYGRINRRDPNLRDSYPTDEQAEILIRGIISPLYILGCTRWHPRKPVKKCP